MNFVSVVAMMQSLNELPEAPSESRKIHEFHATSEDDNQPASSYRLPVGWVSADINDRVLSPLSMRSKVSKLLTYPGMLSHGFYRFEGEELANSHSLNHHVTELAGMKLFENKTEAEDVWRRRRGPSLRPPLGWTGGLLP